MSRRIVIVRHGERVDKVFGEEWIEKAFDSNGNYTKYNLNMPDSVPVKKGMPSSYKDETPLTQVGHLQGYLVGKGLLQQKILRPGFITFVSPALRSIQTATELLKGMGFEQGKDSTHSDTNASSSSNVLKVEPSLFEYTGFYRSQMPTFLTLEELKVAGFRIDENYSPILEIKQLVDNHIEPTEEYYQRSYNFVRHLLDTTDESKDILLVAHGITIDAASRQLFDKSPRPFKEFFKTVINCGIPFAGVGILEEKENGDGRKYWAFKSPGPITLKHQPCHDFEADQAFPNHL